MKVMISQPMRNRSNKEILKEREELVKRVEEEGDIVLDTVFDEAPKNVDESVWFLSKSIEFLASADKVIFMKGWEKARGCKIEHQVAVEYGKEIMYLENI